MADRYLIQHSQTELHLGEGLVWVPCPADALVLTRLQVRRWLSLAGEAEALEVVPVPIAATDCCAA